MYNDYAQNITFTLVPSEGGGDLISEDRKSQLACGLNIAVGLATIIPSILVVICPALAIFALVPILLFSSLLARVARIVTGLLGGYLPMKTGAIAVAIGRLRNWF